MADRRHPIYTTDAHVTGWRANGHGRTSDGALDVELRLPEEMGGGGGGTNPEQLFAIGWAACFKSALGTVAQRRGQEDGDVAIDSRVMLLPKKGGAFKFAAELAISLPSVADPHEAAELVRATHQVCPWSNSTRGNVDLLLTVNGHVVEPAAEPEIAAQQRAA